MKKNKVVAIVQARMGSSRLPGKILLNLQNMPVIWHICERLSLSKEVDKVVVATSDKNQDDILTKCLDKNEIDYFRGSEEDVLDRFYKTADFYKADYVVRITADCPLIDPSLVSKAVLALKDDESLDYVGLACGAGVFKDKINKYPDGLDTEVFTFKSLEKTWNEATSSLDRGESVTSYLWSNKLKFNIKTISSKNDYGNLRWTLDTPEDYEFINHIYNELYNSKPEFGMHDILELIKEKPHLVDINRSSIGQVKYGEYYDRNNNS